MSAYDDRTPTAAHGAAAGEGAPEPDWKRKQRLARIFGDVLPEQTSDDRGSDDSGGAAGDRESATDRWLKSQVPPHHG